MQPRLPTPSHLPYLSVSLAHSPPGLYLCERMLPGHSAACYRWCLSACYFVCAPLCCHADEGHGLVRAANRLDFYSRADQFFKQHLGGRSEPFEAQPTSTAKVITQVQPLKSATASGR